MTHSGASEESKRPPTWVFAILAGAAVTILATYIVVRGVDDVETLSVVALGLALISFSAQFVITLWQGRESSRVNAEMKASLAGLEANSSSLLSNQTGQFDKAFGVVAEIAMAKAVRDVKEESSTSSFEDAQIDGLATQILSRFDSTLDASIGRLVSGVRAELKDSSTPTDRNPKLLDILREFPNESEGRPVYEELKLLPVRSVAALGKIASQLQRYPRSDRTVRFARSAEGPNPDFLRLISENFLEDLPDRGTRTGATLRVTEKGLTALRLVTGKGEPPAWMD